MICKREDFALAIGPDDKLYAAGGYGGSNKYYFYFYLAKI